MGNKIKDKRKKINIAFDDETYEQIQVIASKTPGASMASVVRDFTKQGIDGTLTESNLQYITPIIREQLRITLKPEIERLAKMVSKTCIQAGTAAYLNAEVIANLLPVEQQRELQEAFEKAKLKAVAYNSNKIPPDAIINI